MTIADLAQDSMFSQHIRDFMDSFKRTEATMHALRESADRFAAFRDSLDADLEKFQVVIGGLKNSPLAKAIEGAECRRVLAKTAS